MDIQQLTLIAINSMIVVALTTAIAYHPEVARKRSSISDLELPKTMIIYSIIGMMVGHLLSSDPKTSQAIAFTIFGLGGLMRFRTNLGSTKETGRLIFVTLGGLCVGLNLHAVAFFSFAIIWLLVFFSERRNVFQIVARYDEMKTATESAKMYRDFIKSQGWKLISESRGALKPQVEFVVQTDRSVEPESLIKSIVAAIPLEARGAIQLDVQ